MIRTNAEMYRGYEAKSDMHSFLLAFASAEDAVNFCIATQVSLLHVDWPESILRIPSYVYYDIYFIYIKSWISNLMSRI